MVSRRKQKKSKKVRKKRMVALAQQPTATGMPLDSFESLRGLCIDPLMHIDSMLCQSADIARERYADNPEHLLKIIANQHLGVENLLKKLGVVCRRSAQGDAFDPEKMEAAPVTVPATEPEQDGLVAASQTPAFLHGEEVLVFEVVKLFEYKSE